MTSLSTLFKYFIGFNICDPLWEKQPYSRENKAGFLRESHNFYYFYTLQSSFRLHSSLRYLDHVL